MAKNSGWGSALKEREKSLSASEKCSLSGAGQTLARETVKPTLPRGKYVIFRIFKESRRVKSFVDALATQKGTLWFTLLVAAPFFIIGDVPKPLQSLQSFESVQFINLSHSSTFLLIYSSIHSFIHSSNSSNSSNVSIHSVSPAVKSLQSFSSNVLAKPLMTCDSQNFDQNVEQNFFLQISSDSQVHSTKEDVGDQRGAKNGRTPMW